MQDLPPSSPSERSHQGGVARFASVVTLLTFAPVLAVPVFYFLVELLAPRAEVARDLLTALLFGGLLPILVVVVWSRLRGQELDFPIRETRTVLLPSVAVIYVLGAIALSLLAAPFWVVLLMAGYAGNTALVALLNFRWKVSVHTTGVAGPASFLLFLSLPASLLLFALLPLVGWSRWRLQRHSLAELATGACLGVLASVGQVLISLHVGVPV